MKLVERDLLVLNDTVDLELEDTVSDRNTLSTSPDETILFDGENRSLSICDEKRRGQRVVKRKEVG